MYILNKNKSQYEGECNSTISYLTHFMQAIMSIVSLFGFQKQKVICFALGEVYSLKLLFREGDFDYFFLISHRSG